MIRCDSKLRALPVVVVLSPKDKHIEEKADELAATALAELPVKPANLLDVVEQVLAPFIDKLRRRSSCARWIWPGAPCAPAIWSRPRRPTWRT